MRLQDFVRQNRAELDQCIWNVTSHQQRMTDQERRDWVMNDEGLYQWARSAGCKI